MALNPCRVLSGTFYQALSRTVTKYLSCTSLIALAPTKAHHPQCGTVQVALQPLICRLSWSRAMAGAVQDPRLVRSSRVYR